MAQSRARSEEVIIEKRSHGSYGKGVALEQQDHTFVVSYGKGGSIKKKNGEEIGRIQGIYLLEENSSSVKVSTIFNK